eukprot:COSAG02_NODE_747_length_17723_cov_49.509816_22_plen_52_part_01
MADSDLEEEEILIDSDEDQEVEVVDSVPPAPATNEPSESSDDEDLLGGGDGF